MWHSIEAIPVKKREGKGGWYEEEGKIKREGEEGEKKKYLFFKEFHKARSERDIKRGSVFKMVSFYSHKKFLLGV